MTQLPLQWGGNEVNGAQPRAARREARGAAVRLVEYRPYPRASATQGWRVGFTRDLSTSGMCLEVDRGHPIGSLLRITVRSIDGRPTLDTLARVAWCGEGPDGRFRLGLALLDAGRPTLARVRPMGAMQLARGA